MGQKVSPRGFRLAINRNLHRSVWYANNKEFKNFLFEDFYIRNFIFKRFKNAFVVDVVIKRVSKKLEIFIYSEIPGLIIGRKGVEIEALKKDLVRITEKDVAVNIEEVKQSECNAKCVALRIKKQLENKGSNFRRVLSKSIQDCMDSGFVKGIKVMLSGRLAGVDIARSKCEKHGAIPLHTLKADIDYAADRAETSYGSIGIKVWIYKGDLVLKNI